MTAYSELADGHPGREFADLLYRSVRAVAVARNFPPPPGHEAWTVDAVTETAHDLLDGERGRKRLRDLTRRATDDPSLLRLLQAAAVNHLRDVSRRTDLGALILRLREVLAGSDVFTPAGNNGQLWALAAGPTATSPAPDAALAAAAAGVPGIRRPRWCSERRRAPVADADSLQRLLTAVLTAAGGAVSLPTLAGAVASRLDVTHVPLTVELDTVEHLPDPAIALPGPDAVLSDLRAAELLASMSDRERILCATWGLPVRDLGGILGCGHSQAALLRQRLAADLRAALVDDSGADQTVQALVEQANTWLAARTSPRGATLMTQAMESPNLGTETQQ